jgi:signal transduction histidine kinase
MTHDAWDDLLISRTNPSRTISAMDALVRPLGFEQRESARVLVLLRWVLLAVLLVVVDYPLLDDTRGVAVVGSLILGAGALNFWFQRLLIEERPIPLWLPLSVGAYDAAAITAGIAVIDGFDNTAYVLYYPALMAFSAMFPGRIGLTYAALIIGVYSALSILLFKRFDAGSTSEWRDLGIRVATMGATVLLSYLLVRVERRRRMRAVEAEADRQREVQALQQRAHELELAADEERRRLLREVHDGVSQGVYMLSLGLEGAVHDLNGSGATDGRERLDALVRLSKQTLLESRGLLFDLSGVMRGDARLDELVRHQAEEFRAITGIATTVHVEGSAGTLPPSTVAEVYRVVQESLANVYRHACAASIEVTLTHGPTTTLRVADDGRGFELSEATGRGHGLRSMQERAASIGANLHIDSVPGRGTTITLTIPAMEDARAPHASHAG